jgi:hypothetical protein
MDLGGLGDTWNTPIPAKELKVGLTENMNVRWGHHPVMKRGKSKQQSEFAGMSNSLASQR